MMWELAGPAVAGNTLVSAMELVPALLGKVVTAVRLKVEHAWIVVSVQPREKLTWTVQMFFEGQQHRLCSSSMDSGHSWSASGGLRLGQAVPGMGGS